MTYHSTQYQEKVAVTSVMERSAGWVLA